jgi:hypothetical protein
MAHDGSMDTRQFIASLVSSLAWPGAVLGIALLFRKQLAQLLTGPLRRLKAGPVELEFERLISTVQAQIEPSPHVASPTPTVSGPISSDLADIARKVPIAAIVEGYSRLEVALQERLRSAGDTKDLDRLSGMALARRAADKGLLTPETVNALEGLAVLRNLAAHGRGDDISVDRALDYLALVDAVSYAIRQGKTTD